MTSVAVELTANANHTGLEVNVLPDEAERLRMAARGAGATLSGWLRTIGLREAHILTARTRLQASLDEIRDILETTDAR